MTVQITRSESHLRLILQLWFAAKRPSILGLRKTERTIVKKRIQREENTKKTKHTRAAHKGLPGGAAHGGVYRANISFLTLIRDNGR